MKAILMVSFVASHLSLASGYALAHEGHDHGDEYSSSDALGIVIDEKQASKIEASLAKLGPEDQSLVVAQGFCPIMTDAPLGAMGVPIKLEIGHEVIFVCCKGCQKKALANPEKSLATVEKLKAIVKEKREIAASLAKLSPEDQKLARAQGYCPVMADSPLGSMGAPIKINVNGQSVFLCCKGCQKKAFANPAKTLAAVEALKAKVKEAADIEASLAKLNPAVRSLVRAQGYCAIMTENRLGAMGAPIKVMVNNQPVFLCCKGCQRKALANPQKTLATVAELKKKVDAETAAN